MPLLRRDLLLSGTSLLGLGACSPGAAAAMVLTPRQSLGPFYPRELPLDRDNDLVSVAGSGVTAKGEITHLYGRVLDDDGGALTKAFVEIWQCNAFGRYHHPRDHRNAPLDPGFQGYGQTVTDAQGRYRFRTIKPVSYPGRAPHIHVAVRAPGSERLVTQLYVKDEPANARDGLLNRVWDETARQSLIVRFEPDVTHPGELTANFDIVLGNG